ncbi:MAG TPA: LuxR C-terminal-related transcriptional regulator [Chthoniobacterales bacterium]
MWNNHSIGVREAQKTAALVVADAAHQILFATPSASTWLRSFFREQPGENVLPQRISRWLESRGSGVNPALRARRAGASLFVTKYAPQPADCVVLLLELDTDGAQAPRSSGTLSRRQQDVLRWIATGKSNKAIGEILEISPKTVGKHLENLFRKLGVTNRLAAANAYTASMRHRS